MTFSVQDPRWLWLVALAIPMAIVAWRWLSAMSTARKLSAIILRTALLLTLALMLAGASTIRTSSRLATVAVIDVSGSVKSFAPTRTNANNQTLSPTEQARAWIKAATAKRSIEDLVGLVVFDGDAITVATPREGRPTAAPDDWDGLDRPLDVAMREGSDLAGALRLAVAAAPPDAARRIVLFSDGNQTSGDVLSVARELARTNAAGSSGGATATTARGTPIDVVPFTYRVDREVMVESVDVPSFAPANATVTARIRLWSAAPARGLLRLQQEGRDINIAEPGAATTGRIVDLQAGSNTIVVTVPLDPGRVHRFSALFEPESPAGQPAADQLAANNRADAVTISPGAGSILIVDGVSNADPEGPGAALAKTLRQEDLTVQVVPSESLPADLLDLEKFDLVILQNIPASAVSQQAQDALVRYVTELGGGLVVIGGPDALTAGGWRGSPLEPILPVSLDLPEKMIVPSAALIIVMDTSGSMGFRVAGTSRTQMEIANQGAAVAVRSMDKGDLVGVIQFDNDSSVVIPLAKNTDPEANARAVLNLAPGGGTNLPPALRMASDQLKDVNANIKHVIVLSDGRSQNTERLPFIAEEMVARGIKISTIAVGDLADTDGLSNLAKVGGGTYYRVTDPTILPRLFLKAVQVVRTPMIREKPFTPLITDATSPLLSGITGDIPPLGGLVLTTARVPLLAGSADSSAANKASTLGITYALTSPQGEPVLAHWQVGLGQVAAFTSDASVWAKDWLAQPIYRRLWLQTARTIARPNTPRTSELTTEIVGDQLKLRLDSVDASGKAQDGLAITGAIYAPDGRRTTVRLNQNGPGQYEAIAPANEGGTYVVTLSPSTGATGGSSASVPGTKLQPVLGASTKPPGGEYRTLQSNDDLLKQIAQITGGRVLSLADPTTANLFDRAAAAPQQARLPLWPLLLPLALAILWLDIATRRIAWDRLFSRQFGATLVTDARTAVAQRSEQAAGALKNIRSRERQIEQRAMAQAGAALAGDDARAVALAAKQRRMNQRSAAFDTPQSTANDGGVTTQQSAPTTPPPPNESALAAAKRRARERLSGQ